MTESGLRREATRGRLTVSRVAGKDFTTMRAIEAMLADCVIEPKWSQPVPTMPAPSPKVALDALLLSLEQPKDGAKASKPAKRSRSGPGTAFVC